jgi:predicted ATP-grasp superfamily ATP-dependent carboligase
MMLSSEPTPILLAGNSEVGVLAAVRGLRAAGYAPWLAIDEAGFFTARSRKLAGTVVVPDPRLDGEGFTREVAAAAARLSVAAVLPGAEPYLFAMAGHEIDFAGIALGVPSFARLERATDKTLLPELAAHVGLHVPSTRIVHADTDNMGTFDFPVVVKPPRTCILNADGTVSNVGYHPAVHCDSTEQVMEALSKLPRGEGLIQPYIPGQLVGVAGVSWEGELVGALHQASIRTWPRLCGGSSYAVTIQPNAELELGVGRLLKEIGWSGIFHVQFVRDRRDKHYLIDLNPRIYGSLALAVGAGLNLPGIWVDLLLGRRPDVAHYRVGSRYRHEENDVRALAQMLVDGERLAALRGLIPRRHTTHTISSLRDPMPLLTRAANSRLLPKIFP